MGKTTSSPDSRSPRRRARGFVATLASALVLIAAAIIGAQPAAAESAAAAPQCGAREALIDRLGAKYDEQPVSLGVTATGSLLEVLASATGSWTIIVTVPGGPTCLVSSGEGWRNAPVQFAEKPAV